MTECLKIYLGREEKMKPQLANFADFLTFLSPKEIAETLSVSERTVTRWKKGESNPPRSAIAVLSDIIEKKKENRKECDFTFIDLFAGIGGTRLGVERSGGKCVFTSEWDSYAQKTYKANFGDEHLIIGDIVPYDAKDIPDHDLLVAGFPCQPFSIAGVSKKNSLGRPHGFECTTQGTLFFDVARIIAEKKPKAFLLENVKNLRSHNGGHTFKVIMDVLKNQLGYDVHYRVIDGQHFVPQHRERIIIVGFRKDLGFSFDDLILPNLDETSPKIKDILHPQDGSEKADNVYTHGKKARVLPKYTLTDGLWTYLQNYAAKHREKGNGFGFGMVRGNDVARTLSARYYKDGSEILVFQGVKKNPRRLTPRECARLMGFPDSFRIPVSDTRAYHQFGNSVVVPVIEAVAKHIKPYLMQLKEDCKEENLVIPLE